MDQKLVMNYLLDQMPDEARLWVYQSERQFTGDELEVIKGFNLQKITT